MKCGLLWTGAAKVLTSSTKWTRISCKPLGWHMWVQSFEKSRLSPPWTWLWNWWRGRVRFQVRNVGTPRLSIMGWEIRFRSPPAISLWSSGNLRGSMPEYFAPGLTLKDPFARVISSVLNALPAGKHVCSCRGLETLYIPTHFINYQAIWGVIFSIPMSQ